MLAPLVGQFFQSRGAYKQGQLEAQTSRENTDKTIAANKAMAEYQYSKDLEMWNRGNVYNSPQEQMRRLEAAGLNPNLVYGQGAVGNASGTLPKYNAPTLDYNYKAPLHAMAAIGNSPASVLSQFQDFQIKQAQTNNLREQNRVLRETADQKTFFNTYADKLYRYQAGTTAQKYTYGAETGYQKVLQEEMKTNQMRELFPTQLEFQKGKLHYQDQQITNMVKQGKKIDASTDYQNKVNEWYLTKMFSQLGLQAVGQLGKILPTGKIFNAGNTIQQAGKSFNQKSRAFDNTTRDIYRGKFN